MNNGAEDTGGGEKMWPAIVVLPGNPAQPCPELLTEEEAVRYLRLDTINIGNPSETLRQVSKRVMYRRVELDRFLERLTEQNPR